MIVSISQLDANILYTQACNTDEDIGRPRY